MIPWAPRLVRWWKLNGNLCTTESEILKINYHPVFNLDFTIIPYHPQNINNDFSTKKTWKQTFAKILLTENVPKEKHALSLQNKKILHLVEAQETSWLAQEPRITGESIWFYDILRNTQIKNAIYKIDHLMKTFRISSIFQQRPDGILPYTNHFGRIEVSRCSAWTPWPSSMDFNFRRTPQMSCPRYPPKSCLSRCPRPVSYTAVKVHKTLRYQIWRSWEYRKLTDMVDMIHPIHKPYNWISLKYVVVLSL